MRRSGPVPPSSRRSVGRPSPQLTLDPSSGSLFGASPTYGLDDAILEYLSANARSNKDE